MPVSPLLPPVHRGRRVALPVAVAALAGALVCAGPATPASAAASSSAAPSTAPGQLAAVSITALGGTIAPLPLTMYVDLPFNPWVTGMQENGYPLGSAVAVAPNGPGVWRASWLVDPSYLAGTSTVYRVYATNNRATVDTSVPVTVAAAPAYAADATWTSPLSYAYPTAATAVTPATAMPAVTSTVAGKVFRSVSISAPGASAFSASNAIDTGVSSSTLTGGLRASGAGRVTADTSIVDGGKVAAVGGVAASVRRSFVTSEVDGVDLTGGTAGPASTISLDRIQRNGRPTTATTGAHNDGIQFWQGGNATISRNWITGWSNSAIIIKSDLEAVRGDGPVRGVVISQNYLAAPTADYTLYIANGGKGLPQYITVTDNVFGPSRQGASGRLYPVPGQTFVRTAAERDRAVANGVAGAAAWVVWSGNVDARTGLEVPPPGGWISYP